MLLMLGDAFSHTHVGALVITLISIALMLAWDLPAVKKWSFFRFVPGALGVVLLGVLLNQAFLLWVPSMAVTGSQLVALPVASDIGHFFSFFSLPDFSQFTNVAVYKVAVTIAIIASLETLLSIEAADKLDTLKRTTDANRELKAQGVGNMVSGLIGGLPITAVIVRSSANINAGARSKVSAVFHGLLLLLSAMFIPFLLNIIPLASLAAVLLVIGYKLAKVSLFREMYSKGAMQYLPFGATIVAILATDLLVGILVGLAIGVFFILLDNHKTPYFYHQEDGHHEGPSIRLELSEHVSFLNKGHIVKTLHRLPENSSVVIDGSRSAKIDHDVLEIIHHFLDNVKQRNIRVSLKNIDLSAVVPSTGH
jgi:MFS superfamily sulfate permease-like transporter